MQMGVNYSKRMQELKPMRAINAMLEQHGLNDTAALSYLIDLSKGDPTAVQKLLKDHKIDPLDINVAQDSNYKVTDHSPDPKQLDFQEAIQNTMNNPNGPALIRDIDAGWDLESKEALRDRPEMFNNFLEQIDQGVYEQVKSEVEHQRTLGFMTNVPFIQAYAEVGNAMQKAGVLTVKPKTHSGGMAPLQTVAPEVVTKPAPIDTGIRKAAIKPKTEQPNPNLSSTPRTVVPSKSTTVDNDYASLSDDDFLKLGVPS
jgi:hypothetical protein